MLEPIQEGVYVFKVSVDGSWRWYETVKGVWRRIALAHDHTLHDLMLAILDSVKFDYDHIYVFTYRDELGRTVKANNGDGWGVSASEIEVSTLPLKVGDSMPLIYDFGDKWCFTVTLECIEPPGSRRKLPRVIESHGEAPQQYPAVD